MGRRRRKGKRKRNKSQKQKKKDIIFAVAVTVVIVVAAVILRNLYFYITERDITAENPYPVKGVDVSTYQLDIDWEGLEQEGFKFAFIKATEGSDLVDERFEYNWEHANATAMKVGAYHFLSYDTDGKSQAENFIKTVNKKRGMLPPVVDVEFYGKYDKKHPDEGTMNRILKVVLKELEDEYNRKPIIYTNRFIYKRYISGEYEGYPIWISTPDDIPEKLSDGKEWVFCQYTFHGKSESIADGEKYVDMNVFDGSSWDFRKYDWK